MARYLYSELAQLVDARRTCAKKMENGSNDSIVQNSLDWYKKHTDRIERLVRNLMPSGSGIDSGTKIDLDESHADKLVFTTGFHHMNDTGYYDGWTDHTIIVVPSLIHRFTMRVSGRNRNDIKDYLYDTFRHALDHELSDMEREQPSKPSE